MKKVVIVDYGVGNLFSIKQALRVNGCDPIVSGNPEDIRKADGILLPGVGAFGDAMTKLKEQNLIDLLREQASFGKPMLGVCLGLQLLFSQSYEFGEHEGLNIIPGTVQRFPESYGGTSLQVPFIGWNILDVNSNADLSFMRGIQNGSKLFLVHSYYVQPADSSGVLATCSYQGFRYPTIVTQGNVYGVQGHPEKSGPDGLKIYANWLNIL